MSLIEPAQEGLESHPQESGCLPVPENGVGYKGGNCLFLLLICLPLSLVEENSNSLDRSWVSFEKPYSEHHRWEMRLNTYSRPATAPLSPGISSWVWFNKRAPLCGYTLISTCKGNALHRSVAWAQIYRTQARDKKQELLTKQSPELKPCKMSHFLLVQTAAISSSLLQMWPRQTAWYGQSSLQHPLLATQGPLHSCGDRGCPQAVLCSHGRRSERRTRASRHSKPGPAKPYSCPKA